jgi:hypothetical protein
MLYLCEDSILELVVSLTDSARDSWNLVKTAVVYLPRIFPSDDRFRSASDFFHAESLNVSREIVLEESPRAKRNVQSALGEQRIEEFRPHAKVSVRKSKRTSTYVKSTYN